MRAIIHIGMHKAASTYVQGLVKKNRQLLEEQGLLVITRHGHEQYRRSTDKSQPVKRIKDLLGLYIEELSDKRSAGAGVGGLVSDEALEFLTGNKKNFLHMDSQFKKVFDDVQYCAVIRDQVAYRASVLQQKIKTFKSYDNIKSLVPRALKLRMANNPLNYTDRFGALIGSASTNFIPLHQLSEGKGPLVMSELVEQELGVDTGLWQEVQQKNTNIGSMGVAYASFFRYAMLNELDMESVPNRIRLKMRNHFLSFCRELAWAEDAYFPFSEEDVIKMNAILQKSNDQFARQAWGRDWGEVFPEKKTSRTIFDWRCITSERLNELEEAFYKFMGQFRQECIQGGHEVKVPCFQGSLISYLDRIHELKIDKI